MKRAFVTGATGLVGGAAMRRLLGGGVEVVMATSTPGVAPIHPGLSVVPFNLADRRLSDAAALALASCDAVVHAAAAVPTGAALRDPVALAETWRLNVGGSAVLMAAAVVAGVPAFVHVSALNLFPADVIAPDEDAPPDPPNLYTESKWAVERAAIHFARLGATRFSNLRISAPYGPGWRIKAVIPIFVEAALAGRDLTVTGAGARRQAFTYVDDVALACQLAATRRAAGAFNIAGPGSTSMLELAEAVARLAARPEVRVVVDGGPEPEAGRDRRPDLSRARRELGYVPAYALEDGLRAMIAAVQNPPPPLFVIRPAL